MAQEELIIDLADFSKGFQASDDTTKAPFGSLRKMRNAQVTDRGGISPRPGTILIGTKNSSPSSVKGLYTFKKSFEANEILLKSYDDELEGYSQNHTDQGWFRIKDGFIADKEFGFVHSLFNTSNKNFLVGGNQFDKFFSWEGAILRINGAVSADDTTITVDSTLLPDIYEAKTATANSTTTLTVSTVTWAPSQWVTFHVHITSGSQLGQIRKITSNDGTSITFDALGGSPGNATFEIRRLEIPDSGTLIYNGTTLAYSAVPTSTTITVSEAHASDDDVLVTVVPVEYEANPRGNRFTNYLGRLIMGGVRSALHRDASGALEGHASGSSAFISKINNPLDYTFSGTRVAGEGDIISTPYGGGEITDVVAQENTAYIFKRDYIEAIVYTQDADDLVVREPLKPGAGSVGKITRGNDDLYFFTGSKQFTSIGRVRSQDIRPQTQDIGNVIKRWLAQADTTSVGRGIERAGKIYVPLKRSQESTSNDVVLIFNKNNDSFEGFWDIPAFGITEFNNKYVYGASQSADVYEMFYNKNVDIEGANEFGYSFEVATHYFNLSASKAKQQAFNGLYIEGYIRGGTTIEYQIWKDFTDSPSVRFTFAADEEGFLDGEGSNIYLGDAPLGIQTLVTNFSDLDADGRRHFSARVYFPFVYGNYFSVGVSSSGINQDHETTRFGLMMTETPSVNMNKIKTI